jgi:glycine hydroxymethyltransferase
MHIIAAKAVAFKEALSDEFRAYQGQIIKNAAALADGLMKRNVNLVSGGTDNHLMLIDLRGTGVTGKELQLRLDDVNITANKNTIPFDPEKPFVTSGVRVGTAAVSARGMKEEDMDVIADCIAKAIFSFEESKEDIKAAVAGLTSKYPLYPDMKY